MRQLFLRATPPMTVPLALLLLAVPGPVEAQMPPPHGIPQPYGMPPPYGYAPPGYGPPQARPPISGRCASAMGVCILPGAGFIGTPCFCNTSFGPAQGQVIP